MSTKIDDKKVLFRPAYRLLGLPSVHEVSFPECDTESMDEALDEARNFARVAYADCLKMGIRPTGVSVIIHTVESFTQTKTIHSAAYGYYSHDDVSGYKYNEQMKDGKTIYKQGAEEQAEYRAKAISERHHPNHNPHGPTDPLLTPDQVRENKRLATEKARRAKEKESIARILEEQSENFRNGYP